MDERNAPERDWSTIPTGLLNCVAKNIKEISDFIRYRAVCGAWRSSIQITDIPPQFPWIFKLQTYPYVDDLTFHSICFKKTYRIRTKSLHKNLSGPSEGYMYTEVDQRTVQDLKSQRTSSRSLLNPLNNHEICLPAYLHGNTGLWIGPRQNRLGEYAAFLSDRGLHICHISHNKWHELDLVSRRQCSYFCLNGKIFGAERLTGSIKVININTKATDNVIPPVDGHSVRGRVYLVEASGDILRIFQHYKPKYKLNCQFDVHRLDVNENNSACWVKVNNIGDQAVFVDNFGVFVIKASDIAGIKRNCIYCLNITENRLFYLVVRIDIETRTSNYFASPFKDPQCWFMPNLHQIHTR